MKTCYIGECRRSDYTNLNLEVSNDILSSTYLVSYDCVVLSLEDHFDTYYNKDFINSFTKKKQEIQDLLLKGKKLIILNPYKQYKNRIRLSNGSYLDISRFLSCLFPFDYQIDFINGTVFSPDSNFDFSSKVLQFINHASYEIINYTFSYVFIKDSTKSVIASISENRFVLGLPYFGLAELPKLLKMIDSIDELPNIKSESVIAPEWSKKLHIFNEKQVLKSIEEKTVNKNKIEKEISNLNDELEKLNYIKSILFTQGTHLENVVETILKDIGINVEDSDDKNRVDKIIYIDPKIKSVIEIKGRLTKSASEKDCSQLEKWKMEEMTKLGYEPKGILVMNAFAEIDPVKRQDYFPNQMIAFAKKKELSLVSSDCLLKMYIDFKHGKITGEEIYNDLVTNIGVLDYKPFN